MERGDSQGWGRKHLAIMDGSKRERHALLIGQKERCSHLCGKLARTREMVSMDMGIKDTGNLPAMQTCQIQIDLWIKGGINDECLLVRTNHVGEASFPRPSHLDDLHGTACDDDRSRIPGQTPCLHPSLQGRDLHSSRSQLFCGNLACFAYPTDGDHRAGSVEMESSERLGIMSFERRVSIHMQAARNRPFLVV